MMASEIRDFVMFIWKYRRRGFLTPWYSPFD